MNNYCPRCQKHTEDVISITPKMGLKPSQRICNIECEICGVVKYSGRLTEFKYVDYSKENIDD